MSLRVLISFFRFMWPCFDASCWTKTAKQIWVFACLFQSTSYLQAQTQLEIASHGVSPETYQVLSFKNFFQFPVGPRGLEISPQLKQANGRSVRLIGYMVQQEHGSRLGQFFLTPRPVQMSEHADGDADDLPPATVLVKLLPSQSTWVVPHMAGLIELQGTLSVGRQEADDGRVTWVQLQLHQPVTQSINASNFDNQTHAVQHGH